MTFAYFPTIPNPPNDPGDDVSSMQTNSGSIGNIIAVDHVGFNTPNGGQHNQLSFALNQSAPASGAAGSVMYTNLISSVSELFFKNSRANLQLTDLTVNTSSDANVTMYWIDTPWNIRFLMGLTRTISSGSPLTVTFPNQFSTMYYAGGTPKDPNAHYCSFDYVLSPTPYIVIKTDASVRISFLAIGRL